MSEFKFTSPGVKFRERNLTFVTQTVGVTTLGVVGETLKGPAFEPVFIQDKLQFQQRFGGQSTAKFSNGNLKYHLPYVANAYLDESDQLYVTRVLGLSGYDENNAWAIKLSAGVDPTSVSSGTPTLVPITTYTGGVFQGVTITATGQTGTTFTGWTKQSLTGFTGTRYAFHVDTYSGGTGNISTTGTTYSASSYGDYENMTVAVIRSRGTITDTETTPTMVFDAESVDITDVTAAGLMGSFTITATGTGGTNTYSVSLNPLATNFITNVLGVEAKDKKTRIYVEVVYPELLKWLTKNGSNFSTPFTGVSPYGFSVITGNTITPTTTNGYATKFKTPETPWVVSELKGSTVTRLFKFISISDGNSANQEIKISIGNVNIDTYEFDVIIRDFNDTDANVSVLESYTRCSLNPTNTNYIAKKIGTSNGDYELYSKYVMIELANEVSLTSFPCGFEGINLPNFTDAVQPKVIYKTSYISGSDKVSKTYLGFSNTAFGGNNIDQNLFNFNGYKNDGGNTTGYTKTKGFHFDIAATGTSYTEGTEVIGAFEVGAGSLQTASDVSNSTQTYYDIKTRKFTLAPSGGFDGWNVYRNERSNRNDFRQGGKFDGGLNPLDASYNDFQAWEMAIDTFANPEAVTINLFAVPSITWYDNEILVTNTIEMIEEERTDTLYIIDTHDVSLVYEVGESKPDVVASTDVANSLIGTGIDSSYSCTYFPWLQIKDTQNNVNVYLPPTGEVVKAIAYNDKVKAPWWAPAGLNRGVTGAKKSKFKLSEDARGVLQTARINPMVDYAEVGTAIMGQKTLEIKESALNSINIRRLLLQVKVLIANVAVRMLFEPNDQVAIDEFINKVNPILDKIKRERGLYEFAVKMDDTLNTPESIDRNELYGEIYLKPTRTIEKIGIGFTITPTGASFSDL